jgi:hypothetical protein
MRATVQVLPPISPSATIEETRDAARSAIVEALPPENRPV